MEQQFDPASPDRRIATLAVDQHGVVTRAQLKAAGLGAKGIANRIRRGQLHRVHHGVYGVGLALLTVRGRWMAAVLACGGGAALSHRSAGAHLGLRRSESALIEVTVPTRGGRKRSGIAIHRTRSISAAEATRHQGIPVTTPARTLLDLADVVPRRALERALDEAERLRLFDLRALEAVIERNPGRVAGKRLAAALQTHLAGSTVTDSELEEHFLALCDRHDLPRPHVQVPLLGYRVDFLWRMQRLVVETDGRGSHLTRAGFEKDRERDARLTAAGYRVVRFTYRQLSDGPAGVADIVRSLLFEY